MPKRSRFEPGQRVRLNLPGSKLHGVCGVLKAPRPPAGWWLVVSDVELEQAEGEALDGELARTFIAPDLWLEPAPPLEPHPALLRARQTIQVAAARAAVKQSRRRRS